ncbi:HTTM domain-containing protein [Streptomyces sp. NBC_01020]|uniref:HTTM domain-containing protein n=1 Tax=unclassified Streptomyces TaxID=2593676 RepID=UPI0038695C94|nr:HTTM domain-containing protein [Streptomyces sp. NBC_01020]WSX72122.1 HTTM domain-containing protein [Streptomyces sp. NBC_00932]
MIARGIQRITEASLGRYQSAVVRIGFSATWLLFLLRELPHRRELYGPHAPWDWGMAEQLIAGNHAFTVLMWSDSTAWFEVVYAVAVLSSVLLLLGWHTRFASALFMIGVLSLQNRSIFVGDGGDNVVHIMAIYLLVTRCSQVWSLDARRAARAAQAAGTSSPSGPEPSRDRVGPLLWSALGIALVAITLLGKMSGGWELIFWAMWLVQGLWWVVCRMAPGEPRTFLDVVANLAHNAGLVVIMAEVCLIYSTAGWYKIQGSRWEDGTALYYPLNLHYFSPWPGLSSLLATSGVMVMLLTYGTVIVQVAFPFTLFNRRVKNVLLVAMILEHVGIAVLLGLPFFSMAMVAADAVFLPTGFLLWLGGRAAMLTARTRAGGRKGPAGSRRPAEGEQGEQPRTLVG